MRMPRDRLVSTIFGNTCDGLIPRRFGVTPKFANLTSAKASTPSRSPHLRARAHRQSSRASPTFVRRGGCCPHLPGIPAQPWRRARASLTLQHGCAMRHACTWERRERRTTCIKHASTYMLSQTHLRALRAACMHATASARCMHANTSARSALCTMRAHGSGGSTGQHA